MSAIRAKADALENHGAERIDLAAETVTLLVAALRQLAIQGLIEPRGTYLIAVRDAFGNHVVEHIGVLTNHAAARAAFPAACEARPNQR